GTERRMTSLPEVPTVAETLPGFVSSAWFAVVAPPKTPQGIAAKINADINEALRQPDIVKRLADLSAEPVGGTTAAAAAFMRQEVERWGAVIKATGIKLEERFATRRLPCVLQRGALQLLPGVASAISRLWHRVVVIAW